jgi:hypothetical protein
LLSRAQHRFETGFNLLIVDRKSEESSAQHEHLKTAERIGDELGISANTVRRDARFADAVDEIGKNVGSDARTEILSGKSPMGKDKIASLAGKPAEEQAEAIAAAKNPAAKQAAPMPYEKLTKSEQEAKQVRDEFTANLDKVSDGGVYTVETLADATGIATSATAAHASDLSIEALHLGLCL